MTPRDNLQRQRPPLPPLHGIQHQHYYPTRPPPPSSSSSSSSSSSCKGYFCCLFLLFSFLALLVLAIFLVIILAVKPKKPQFDLDQVIVQYIGINTPYPSAVISTADQTTAVSLSFNIRMLFTVENPNKVRIKYGESRFTVMYRGIPLEKTSVPRFYQEAHSVKKIVATITVDRVNLIQADAEDLIRDSSLNDRVELRILGDVGVKIRVMNLDSPNVQVSVDCVVVISPRKQSLTYRQCGFDGLSDGSSVINPLN